ncbi:MAG: hypothetical protein AAFX85_06630 [Pseudomonadota bacterium]
MSLTSKRWAPRALLLVALLSVQHAMGAQTCPKLLFATDLDGVVSGGSKAQLIEAVQRGEALRLGWEIDFDEDGASDLSHWSEGAFLTVWEGEVFAQVTAIHRQRPRRGQGDVELTTPFTEWRGLLSTKGEISGALDQPGSEPGRRRVSVVWCGEASPPAWTVLLRHDADGRVLEGDRSALRAAIRAGVPVRVGWGLEAERDGERRSVEHVADPVFITINHDDHVAAQLPEHIAQRSYWATEAALFDDPSVMWRGLLTTQGAFDAVWVDRASGEVLRRSPQRAALTWYALHSGTLPAALPLAVPRGVRLDETRADERLPPATRK